jgi:HK97 family phage portal protein
VRLNPFRRTEARENRDAKALSASPAVIEAIRAGQRSYPLIATPARSRIAAVHVEVQSATYGAMYQRQPAVRRVVDYLARNTAQLGIKLYDRVDDADREEVYDHPAAAVIRRPNRNQTRYRFVFGMVADWAVYDNAYALIFETGIPAQPITLVKVPPHAMGVIGLDRFSPEGYRVYLADGTWRDLAVDQVVHWAGYDPEDERLGYSKLETLRLTLAEDAAAQQTSAELMKAGLAQPGHIERPLEAPQLTGEAANRVVEEWANQRKDPTKDPLLEEGMEFKPASVTPKDAEMLDGRRFTVETVAGQYGFAHVPPEGEDEQKQFYSDVLAPLIGDLTEVLNAQLLDREFDAGSLYYEFNLADKLRGDAAERYKTLVSAAGAPILTRNEARARENLPALDGGDELITPLNVVVGDKPSVVPMPPQDPLGPSQDGDEREAKLNGDQKSLMIPRREAADRARNETAAEIEGVLLAFLRRFEDSTKSRRISFVKAATDPRWRRELSLDLLGVALRSVAAEGNRVARRLGSEFDVKQTKRYLEAVAERRSTEITTALEAALADPDVPDADVFERARDVSSPSAAMTMATSLSAFSAREAGKQAPDRDARVKTWIVTSSYSSHPELDGETVPLGAVFSNGEDGPPSSDHPGCQCLLEIS